MQELLFLGCGGSRIVTITQARSTGGFVVRVDRGYLVVDPGPGSIYQFNRLGLSPWRVRGLLVSHSHPDHYTDAEIYIEAMTNGARKRRGVLVAARSVLEGLDGGCPPISAHHLNLVERKVVLEPGGKARMEEVEVTGLPAYHSDPTTIGFRFDDGTTSIAYLPDTAPRSELTRAVAGVDLLVVCVLKPGGEHYPQHLCTDNVAELAAAARPRQVVMTHFGARLLRAGPEKEAARVEELTGIRTIAAHDGLRISLIRH
jgi:ribonuclease BN (tRNA processing enzyme)